MISKKAPVCNKRFETLHIAPVVFLQKCRLGPGLLIRPSVTALQYDVRSKKVQCASTYFDKAIHSVLVVIVTAMAIVIVVAIDAAIAVDVDIFHCYSLCNRTLLQLQHLQPALDIIVGVEWTKKVPTAMLVNAEWNPT